LATGARQLVVHDALEMMWCVGRLVGLEVDAAAQRDVGILGRGADQDLLGRGQVLAGASLVDELAGALEHDVDAVVLPRDLGRVLLRGDHDLVAVDDQRAVLGGDGAGVATVDRVVLEQVAERADVGEVVDEDEIERAGRVGQAADEATPDATETVDAYANLGHGALRGEVGATLLPWPGRVDRTSAAICRRQRRRIPAQRPVDRQPDRAPHRSLRPTLAPRAAPADHRSRRASPVTS
jgi:hypothetical protein